MTRIPSRISTTAKKMEDLESRCEASPNDILIVLLLVLCRCRRRLAARRQARRLLQAEFEYGFSRDMDLFAAGEQRGTTPTDCANGRPAPGVSGDCANGG